MKSLSRIGLFVTTWIVAYQAPPSMGFSRQEYWSGLPFPSPGDIIANASVMWNIQKEGAKANEETATNPDVILFNRSISFYFFILRQIMTSWEHSPQHPTSIVSHSALFQTKKHSTPTGIPDWCFQPASSAFIPWRYRKWSQNTEEELAVFQGWNNTWVHWEK